MELSYRHRSHALRVLLFRRAFLCHTEIGLADEVEFRFQFYHYAVSIMVIKIIVPIPDYWFG